jgi:hypothetical protein
MMKVYTPEDVMNKCNEMIPDFVIAAFNDLLSENYVDGETVIKQNDAISRILQYSDNDELTRETIFKKRWLDIESLYRKNGWEVSYEKPAFDERFDPYFVFKPKKKN